MEKILLIDKPRDWTSFDVIAKIRNELKRKTGQKNKVGHAGTLDPFATGLLIVLVGNATKKQDEYMKKDKEYEATLRLGFTSTTGDPEGEISPCHSEQSEESRGSFVFTQDDINRTLQNFTGITEQTPHAFSAIKINGKRAYELARAGEEVKIHPRKITIHEVDLIDFNYPELKIRVNCSSGTYIRTLAEDIGKELGCGAYLTELRRTKIDNFEVKDAMTVEEVLEAIPSLYSE